MKLGLHLFVGAILITGCALPVLAQDTSAPSQYQNDQDRDRSRNTQAYADGYSQGQADARGHAIRNDQPTSQWTKDDDMHAYRQGYDAGWANIMGGRDADMPHDRMASGDRQAEQFGYQDGVAAGRQDQMKGDKFKPADHDLYKNGLHGWTASLGTKDEFKQLYREGFMKGYQQGYQGTGPR